MLRKYTLEVFAELVFVLCSETTKCDSATFRLAGEIVTAEITATLSADGILTVEAPVPEESVPTVTVIPIKVDKKIHYINHK